MAENNADLESTNLKIEVDIGGVSYRTELIKEMVDIVPMDQEDENIEVQEMKETVKFYRGEEGVSFSRVGNKCEKRILHKIRQTVNVKTIKSNNLH